jgi:hypothetical protein
MVIHAALSLSLLGPAYMAYDLQGSGLVIAWALACAVTYLVWTDLPLRLAAAGPAGRTILAEVPRAALHLALLALGFLIVHKTVYVMVLAAMLK